MGAERIKMVWKGFLKESKFFMSYPSWRRQGELYNEGTYCPSMSDDDFLIKRREWRKKKIRFWLAFPKAWLRFNYFMLRDKIMR